MKITNRILFALLSSALFVTGAGAQTINAASCSASDVQNAFNSVTSSTTTVNIPAGTCTWTTGASLTVPSGSTTLTIQGQTTCSGSTPSSCTDSTVVIDDYASSNALISIATGSSSSFFRLTGITLQGGTGSIKYGTIQFSGNSQNFRMDHNHLNVSTYTSGGGLPVRIYGWIYGVFDHNVYDSTAGTTSECIDVYQGQTYGGYSWGDGAWNDTTGLGSSRFLFLENNTFNSGNFYFEDCSLGGREVLRYNVINQGEAQTHPTGGAGRWRGCRAKEVYQNTFNGNANCNGSSGYSNCLFNAYWLSSGTGVVWGNSAPVVNSNAQSGYCYFITAHSMRADGGYTQIATPNGWGYCGTQVNGTGSNWDQNSNTVTGYQCMDQPGEGAGDLLSGGFTSDGSGSNNVTNVTTGCSSSQSCAWVQEALEPIYEWSDTFSPVPNNPGGILGIPSGADANDLAQNRDIYLYTSNFTGASGVGMGTYANMPSTCTQYVAYWATDKNTLYQCSATNTWSAYYTPYTYPHPLTQTAPPDPPTGAQAVAH